MKRYIISTSALRKYVKAYWYDDEESADDFIYKPSSESNTDSDELPYEVLSDDPYEGNVGYDDIDEYDLYDYSEYEDFYKSVLRRRIYVPARVASDIPDYNAYRKALFNTLFLSMKSGESIETVYQELCKDFPGIVKPGFLSASDMLLEIVDATLYAQNVLKE